MTTDKIALNWTQVDQGDRIIIRECNHPGLTENEPLEVYMIEISINKDLAKIMFNPEMVMWVSTKNYEVLEILPPPIMPKVKEIEK